MVGHEDHHQLDCKNINSIGSQQRFEHIAILKRKM